MSGTYSKHNIRVNVSYPSPVDGTFKTVLARFWHIQDSHVLFKTVIARFSHGIFKTVMARNGPFKTVMARWHI